MRLRPGVFSREASCEPEPSGQGPLTPKSESAGVFVSSHRSQTCRFAQLSSPGATVFLPSGGGTRSPSDGMQRAVRVDGGAVSAPKGAVCPETRFVGQCRLSLSLTASRWSGAGGGVWPEPGGLRGDTTPACTCTYLQWTVCALPSGSVADEAPLLWTQPSCGLISLPTDLSFPVHILLFYSNHDDDKGFFLHTPMHVNNV